MISFIIPAYNEQDNIGRTLQALHQAVRSLDTACEILVVDDSSTDRTAPLAAAGGACVLAVRKRHIAATRNAGARAAKGDYLFFIDADTWINAPLLHAAVHALRQGAVGGGSRFRFDRPLPWYGKIAERIVPPLYSLAGLASGSFLFCTRSAFEAVGGFDEARYASEEVWLSLALRKRGRFVILREHVITSGRKLRVYSLRETFRLFGYLLRTGPRALHQREGLEFWYGERRADTSEPEESG